MKEATPRVFRGESSSGKPVDYALYALLLMLVCKIRGVKQASE